MNIKFRMPKTGRIKKGRGIMKEILMTVVATSISIVLTFGTAQWLEHQQKVKDGRQMAMMVISDIDANVKTIQQLAKEEEREFGIAKYVESHMDQLEDMPIDTLFEVWSYILDGEYYSIDDSKERIFNSSQETWKVIDNPSFINTVQTFYQERRDFVDITLHKERTFRAPMSYDDEYAMLTSRKSLTEDDVVDMIRQVMPTRKVSLFLYYSAERQRTLNAMAGEWQRKSDLCKFIMDITDEELAEYLNKQNRTGDPVSKKQLVGTWVSTESFSHEESIEFKKDNSFVHILTQNVATPIFVGKVTIARVLEGTWHLKGDSLYRDYKSDVRTLDKSGISYSAEMKDSVEKIFANYERAVEKRNEKVRQEGLDVPHRSNAAFINRSGNKIELRKTEVNDDGEEETSVSHMVRQKK
jgi:hypothetical protein